MKPYHELTERGQIRRLLNLALQAVQHYDLPVKRVSFLARHTNDLFKVLASNGEKYVMRIYSDADSTLKDTCTEIFWLNALAGESDLNVVQVVPRKEGEWGTLARSAGIPSDKRCVLFRWVPGTPLENRITTANYYQLGAATA